MNWDSCKPSTPIPGYDGPTLGCVFGIIATVILTLIEFSGAVAIFLIIYSGIKYMTSNGDPKQIDGAKKTLTYAILGLFLVFAAYAIVAFISYATGVGCISPIHPLSFSACG